tara:strand:- start:34445 stop:35038 length:594 start_codon:yes stop_codon:yes gene_type:complete
MKGRESGMPEESWWASFFDAKGALEAFWKASPPQGNLVEFGCGYGTFTLPVALRTTSVVTALDIEPEMVTQVRTKAAESRLKNINVLQRDFVKDGTGLATGSQSHAMIFNLLHLEHPVALLREAYRVLKPGGSLSIMHWRSDIPTPRGPALDIRPRPQQCEQWLLEAGFNDVSQVDLASSCPYHYGLIAWRQCLEDG